MAPCPAIGHPAAGPPCALWGYQLTKPRLLGCQLLHTLKYKRTWVAAAFAVRRVALALLKDSPEELLRRLSIICLEDAVLHAALPMLSWAAAAQVGSLINP